MGKRASDRGFAGSGSGVRGDKDAVVTSGEKRRREGGSTVPGEPGVLHNREFISVLKRTLMNVSFHSCLVLTSSCNISIF